MYVIPKSQKEFSSPLYWQKFFDKQEAPFEWYGDYDQLGGIIERYLKVTDQILQIGCGNSRLSEQLYDNGFRNIRSIDTDAKVIKRQKSNNAKNRSELVFECESAAQLNLPDESINVVLDKGTTDALLPVDYTKENLNLLGEIFSEVERCLQPFGRFIIVTLAQEHIIQAICGYFMPSNCALITVHKSKRSDKDFVMPVFIIVITKLKSALKQAPAIRFIRETGSKIETVSDCSNLLNVIKAEQELNWFNHYVSKNIVDNVSIRICDADSRLKYFLTIVDNSEARTLRTMGAFIVPLGRESEWLYSTAKGRRILRKTSEYDRLIVVGLSREQTYGSLTDVQNDLEEIVVRLKPHRLPDIKIDFCSLGAVDVAEPIATGESMINGRWSIEQVCENGRTYRRLIFLSSAGLVQSEAEVSNGKSSKIVSSTLTCAHHRTMLTAVNFIAAKMDTINGKEIFDVRERQFRVAVLGLGGGLFPRFLYEFFTKAQITSVELDKEVLSIARNYFGLPKENKRFEVLIQDARTFLAEVSNGPEEKKYDIVFVDLAGPIQTDGLSCPPAAFVTNEALSDMKNCLKNKGVLAVNLVTRDDEKSMEVKQQMKKIFLKMYSSTSDDDVNEVLICPIGTADSFSIQTDDAIVTDESISWLESHVEELRKLSVVI